MMSGREWADGMTLDARGNMGWEDDLEMLHAGGFNGCKVCDG